MLANIFLLLSLMQITPEVVSRPNVRTPIADDNDRRLSANYCEKMLIDFNLNNDLGIKTGTIIKNQYKGVTITGQSRMRNNKMISDRAMIFNSERPTGGDNDLRFNNRGGILILSEDGDRKDPDDNLGGGTLTFRFHQDVQMDSIIILDNESGVTIIMRDAQGKQIDKKWVRGKGDRSQELVKLDATQRVRVLIIIMKSSGAIDDLRYTVPCAPKSNPPTDVKCNRPPIKTPISKIGKFAPQYNPLAKCTNEYVANLDDADASGIWLFHSGDREGKVVAEIDCTVHDGSSYDLIVYSREDKYRNKEPTEGFGCINFGYLGCPSGLGGGPEIDVEKGTEYAFVIVTQGQLGDHLEIKFDCFD